jgi:hypothetical protein
LHRWHTFNVTMPSETIHPVGRCRAMTILEQTIAPSGTQLVACPICNARFMFRRSDAPHIDDCGFESYRFTCHDCGAALAGIIDPFDEALLLCEAAAEATVPAAA